MSGQVQTMIMALVQIPLDGPKRSREEVTQQSIFNEDWADWMEGRFGACPTLTLFGTPVVLDNEKQEVRVEGIPVNRFPVPLPVAPPGYSSPSSSARVSVTIEVK